MAKLWASSGGELTLPKLLADVGGASALDSASANAGGFAFDIKGSPRRTSMLASLLTQLLGKVAEAKLMHAKAYNFQCARAAASSYAV